jgi:hypothetical protein
VECADNKSDDVQFAAASGAHSALRLYLCGRT